MNNLGYFTDAFFLEEGKEIVHFPDFTFVRSPSQPTFYFGNFLLLNKPPSNSDKEKLEELFKQHFVDIAIQHFTFSWSGDDKSGVQTFLDSGYELEEISVLSAKEYDIFPLVRKNEEIIIRTFNSNKDWEEWIEYECKERPAGYTEKGFTIFLEGRRSVYDKLNKKACGDFYGAYINDELVASAGLYYQDKIGRFQSVRTKEEFRRKGICKTLVHHICKEGFKKADTLVIAADKGYYALGIYEGLGFKQTDSQTSVFWKKKE